MKTYEKPKMVILSLDGNERLCGDCADAGANKLLVKDPKLAAQFDWLVGDGDGKAERSDLAGLFGSDENCQRQFEDYCKFTSSGNLVAWS